MKNKTALYLGLSLAFVLLMSLPWLVPHLGWTALVGLLPLLILERLATQEKLRHFWWWHYGCFVLWNAVTTWWVGEATVGGAVFAILANALQMSLVFGSFRWVKRRSGGALPYLYLAAAWLAWEKYYLSVAQISWPWLVLGNAFADTTGLVQWYSVLGSLGGSLWVLASNLGLFGLMVALSDGQMARWTGKARAAALMAVPLVLFGPMLWSWGLSASYREPSEPLQVVIGQPNFDPYQKFTSLTQEQQDSVFLGLVADIPAQDPVLVLAPETFTSSFRLDFPDGNPSFRRYQAWLHAHPNASLLFGISGYDGFIGYTPPSPLSYDQGVVDSKEHHLWLTSRNSAVMTDTSGRCEVYHKSKLVVGTELTPYPAFFLPLERLLGAGQLMGRCVGQQEVSCLHAGQVPIGCAVCYESVYGEHCAGYVRKGARLLTVITNDAWWGDTPGYGQHLNYSRLRAIETRRYIARCGNTGVSAIIDPRGRILSRTPWWQEARLDGTVRLSRELSFYVRYGDLVGRISVLLFLLLGAAAVFRPRK